MNTLMEILVKNRAFIKKNASENFDWEMAAILFRGRWIKYVA